jgi:CelD/BcsL family acetyltransferase involved in cellulose biosynthesis
MVAELSRRSRVGIVGPRDFCWWFPAFDPELGRFSPGTIMMLALAEQAPSRGIARIDLGGGEENYKLRLATDSYRTSARLSSGEPSASP